METNESPKLVIDVYALVTNRIIELLEGGTIPWQQPWKHDDPPMNLLSKRQYRGINLWLLLSLQYKRNLFLTWDQIKGMGASVLKDQHGHIVVFWKNINKKEEVVDEKPKQIPMLRYYKVFNIEQCRDIPTELIPLIEAKEFDPILECESLISNMPQCPVIQHKEQKAYYHIVDDYINMPKKKSFKIPEAYYHTLFHELVHSTGAQKRLGRKSLVDMAPFGSESYALEELVAEMGSAFLSNATGILQPQEGHTAAYIRNWLEVFKNDKRFIISASGHAQKAADFILGKSKDDTIIETHHPVEAKDE